LRSRIQDILKELNEEQRPAVETTEGPILVLAGAGSGKTRVLTYRMAYILRKKKIAPWEILVMTFTNKAAGEMKERIQSLVGNDNPLWVGTFHSTFAKILRREIGVLGYSSDFVIYDTNDQERMLKFIMGEMNISPKEYSPKSIRSVISITKNRLISPENYASTAKSPFEKVVTRIFPVYENRLRFYNALDFDDLITVPIKLFTMYPDILLKYQSRFKYILVDEYQDTNRAQYLLLYHLSKEHRNICVVGDDDQSIYRWRGADIRNILEFENDFPDSQVFRLEQNYRSTQTILKAANSVIEKNVGRKGKSLWSARELGEKIDLLEVVDEREEAQKVVEKIKVEVFKGKRTFREFAVLYRTNAQSRSLEDGLRKSGMSYVIVGGVRFYERKEIKDVLAYLKLIANPKDSISLKRIVNFPLRGIGDGTLRKIDAWAESIGMHMFETMGRIDEIPDITSRIKTSVRDFYGLIQKYIDLKDQISPNELAHTIVDETGLLTMYKGDTSPEGQGRAENIREFLAAVSEYAVSTDSPSLSGFLEEVSLITDIDTWNDKSNAITLMTLHCAKGLEFPVVFITGLEDGLFPVLRSLDEPEALEEERRLFYVGLTRAKEKIYLSCAERRRLFYDSNFRLPSRFLDEIDSTVLRRTKASSRNAAISMHADVQNRKKEAYDSHPDYEDFSQEKIQYRPGVCVNHEKYGKGRIVRVEGEGQKKKVIVRFEDGAEKKFLLQYARFAQL